MEGDSRYENRLPEEGINVSNEHPLKEFFSLLVAGLIIVVACVAVLAYLSAWLAPKIPFEFELALAERFESQIVDELEKNEGTSIEDGSAEASVKTLVDHREAYIDSLVEKYLAAYPLPEGMSITVHYIDDDTVNAFATLGGHIFIHGGLFDALKTENALAFVLGHEIGHVVARHPISSLGRGMVVAVAVTSILGMSDSVLPDWLLSDTTNITMLSFSREQESLSDLYALNGMAALYGHVSGSGEFFEFIQTESEESSFSHAAFTFEILQTHPLSASRLEAITEFEHSRDQSVIELIPFPDEVVRGE